MCACSNQTGQCGLSLSHLSFFLAFSSSLLWPVSLTMCVVAQVGSIFIIRSFFLLRSAFPAPSSFYWADVRACPASLLWLMMHDRCTRSTSPLALGACVCVCVCMPVCVGMYVCMYVCVLLVCTVYVFALHHYLWAPMDRFLCVLCIYIQWKVWCIRLLSNTAQ